MPDGLEFPAFAPPAVDDLAIYMPSPSTHQPKWRTLSLCSAAVAQMTQKRHRHCQFGLISQNFRLIFNRFSSDTLVPQGAF
jgi:hypothetical protein